jgi:hypothetical protein
MTALKNPKIRQQRKGQFPPIPVRGPIPSSSASSNPASGSVPIPEKPISEIRRGIVCAVQIHPLPQVERTLTFNLLTWTKWWAPASASKWRMEFNSAFKGLK